MNVCAGFLLYLWGVASFRLKAGSSQMKASEYLPNRKSPQVVGVSWRGVAFIPHRKFLTFEVECPIMVVLMMNDAQ